MIVAKLHIFGFCVLHYSCHADSVKYSAYGYGSRNLSFGWVLVPLMSGHNFLKEFLVAYVIFFSKLQMASFALFISHLVGSSLPFETFQHGVPCFSHIHHLHHWIAFYGPITCFNSPCKIGSTQEGCCDHQIRLVVWPCQP